MIRAFIAIDIPHPVKEVLRHAYLDLRDMSNARKVRGIKWVEPGLWHLTLKFLGEIPEAALTQCSGILRNCVLYHHAFELRLRGIGVFPGPRRPRVLWVGVEERPEVLSSVHCFLDKAHEKAGIPRESLRFHPHLTIGRVKRLSPGTEAFCLDILKREVKTPWFDVRHISLYKSTLTPKGPVYSLIKRVSLS